MKGCAFVNNDPAAVRELVIRSISEAGNIGVLATKIKASRSAIHKWLTGESNPCRSSLAKLEGFLRFKN
jgi:hypothetical protein